MKDTMDLIDGQVTAALNARPRMVISADFAARVARGLPPHRIPVAESATVSAGRRIAWAALIGLFVAMLGLGLRAQAVPGVAFQALEWSLAAEFSVLAVWLARRPARFYGPPHSSR